jgi:hypothetical protein
MTTHKLARRVEVLLYISWNGSTLTDETNYLISAKGAYEYFPPAESYQSAKQVIQQMDLTLRNEDRRFSAWHSGSVVYPYRANAGAYHKEVILQMRIDEGDWQPIFRGYIKTSQENYEAGTINFKVWDLGEIMRQRYSTPMLVDYLEHDLIIYYLELAGMVDGTHFISPTYAAAHSVDATIDLSTRRIPYSWLDDEQVWDEIVDVAQATGSRVFVDAAGMVHFEKGYHWITYGTADVFETLSEDHYQSHTYGYDDKSFYDEFVVGYTQRRAGDSQEEIWRLDQAKMILPGANEEIIARFGSPAINITPPAPNSHYQLLSLAGQDVSGAAEINAAFEINAQQCKITITNGWTEPILLWNAFFLGQQITGEPAEQVKRYVAGKGYDRRLEVRNNFYVQTKPQAEAVADFMSWWYGTAKPTVTLTRLRGKPERTLGKRVKARVRGVEMDGIIIRCGWNITIADLTVFYSQDVTLIENVFNAENYFIVGQSLFSENKVYWF